MRKKKKEKKERKKKEKRNCYAYQPEVLQLYTFLFSLSLLTALSAIWANIAGRLDSHLVLNRLNQDNSYRKHMNKITCTSPRCKTYYRSRLNINHN